MALTDIDMLRIEVGDNNPEFQLLPDETYEYFLSASKANGSIRRAKVMVIPLLLMELAKLPTMFRLGDLQETNDWVNGYKSALEIVLENPNLSMELTIPYAGGISRADMENNYADPDVVVQPAYKGISSGIRPWNNRRLLRNESDYADRDTRSLDSIVPDSEV